MTDLTIAAILVVVCCAGWLWIARTPCDEERDGEWVIEEEEEKNSK